MLNNTASFLFDFWYLATPGSSLKTGTMLAKTILGQPILLGRSKEGKVFALRNICPHRAVPLSHGCFDGKEIECCYHGWRFNTQGHCTAIPSLSSGQQVNFDRIRVFSFPCREIQGNVWIYMPSKSEFSNENLPAIPGISIIQQERPNFIDHLIFPCHVDHAIVGLMDPAHGAFVHRSWWWRDKNSLHEKSKEFSPVDFGFRMQKHSPSKNSKAYKFLLGKTVTEISFYLPGIRIEHISVGSHNVYALTTTTPMTETTTEVHQFFYWDMPWLTWIKPLLAPLARKFLRQDYEIVKKQQVGLLHQKELMLIHDADTQARWYYQLKKEYLNACEENREFKNPIAETVLRWCS
jgi:phenylpropionate dioxygenase-like ring-hydroxylating dioxygenase large terminal subunit